jgi:hypothetical protein
VHPAPDCRPEQDQGEVGKKQESSRHPRILGKR